MIAKSTLSSRSRFALSFKLAFFCHFIYAMGIIMIAKIHDRIIAVREALGLTQRDFCKGIYVSQSYYAQIENGSRPANDRIIALICSQYGVNKEFLLKGKGELFTADLPDIQLQQLLEVFHELDRPFKDYIIMQIKQLTEAVDKSKEESALKEKTPTITP